MKINDILKLSMTMLGLSGQDELTDQGISAEADESVKEALESLLTCANLAYEEVCTEYFPLKEQVLVKDGYCDLSKLDFQICGVLSCEDSFSKTVAYRILDNTIQFDTNNPVVLTLCKIPKKFGFGEQIDTLLPVRVLAYGTVREFHFMRGESDEALLYDNRFKGSLENFIRKKIAPLQARRWNK